jgi:hypothetical protein
MGKVRSELGGAISGMVGPVVFYTIKGKTFVRSAIKERQKDSWSPEQVIYRQKVSKTAAFWKSLAKNPIRETYNLAAENMSGYNLFLKTNLPAFGGDGTQMDLERLHLSAGTLPLPLQLKAVAVEGDPTKWKVSWKDDSGIGLSQSIDKLVVVFAQDGKFSHPVSTGVLRNQESAIIPFPESAGIVQGMYLSFASVERVLYSVDQYFGV